MADRNAAVNCGLNSEKLYNGGKNERRHISYCLLELFLRSGEGFGAETICL